MLNYDVQVVSVGTGSATWVDPQAAAIRRDVLFPRVSHAGPTVRILDFGGIVPVPAALSEFLVPIGEGIRSGRYGTFSLFVTAPDDATREFVQYLANARDFPIYIAPSVERLAEATPAGELTFTERETLDVLAREGGTLTATQFAATTGTAVTTAGNRLINLARRGYLHRIPQSGRFGDLFVDPRTVRLHSAL